MFYQLYYYYLVPFIFIPTVPSDHINNNNSDVIVMYSGHAEADEPIRKEKPKTETTMTETPKSTTVQDETEGVLFIPNERPVYKNENKPIYRNKDNGVENTRNKDNGNIKERIINDGSVRIETEPPPNKDILFVIGKNNANENLHYEKDKKKTATEARRRAKETDRAALDCSNLDCNNTIKSVCGGKMEHKLWKYRLFLNDCYFRKVNCNFKYEENRYMLVADEHCKPIAAHYSERPPVHAIFQAQRSTKQPDPKPEPVRRRIIASRRSNNKNVDGSPCSHSCPSVCSEHYDPECAVSTTGIRRVFMNHCKLDFNSCSYGTVWYRRPLAECVGGKKADMARNSGFIGWMQRVGIVDNKGRLKLQ